MLTRFKNIPFIALAFVASASYADPQCSQAPESDWIPFDTAKQQLVDEGYTIKKFKKTDTGCYELYGKDSQGERVEIYFDPTNMQVIKEERG
ncbi:MULTISPECIES: PepSY domain-containing protein [unclassified Motilimonas]|uniref:PepSY domain-containing protein n=1 Tax=Motilimonas TaxID=1914248 RepID=UPI001E45BE0F|nr:MULTISPECIES: PepSY domain-containing protein [unclassified Motilimonas]MCE0558968.1 PepSY domain-containing protein [Motilimonas sp. E26]MDO6527391.1 PepSY domain-containing protein [Motilimonas sp. 1_MG-2023]